MSLFGADMSIAGGYHKALLTRNSPAPAAYGAALPRLCRAGLGGVSLILPGRFRHRWGLPGRCKQLAELGEVAGPALNRALANAPSGESRRRIKLLLDKFELGPPSPRWLQAARALEVLEHIGTAEAQRLLRSLAQGTPEVRSTEEARAALNRLADSPALR